MTLWQQLKAESASLRNNSLAADDLLETIDAYARHEGCTPDEAILLLLGRALMLYREADHDHRSWKRLSAREKQVAVLMCDGSTNRQIAAKLVSSPETVKTHARHLLRKFDIRSRRELRTRLRSWDLSEWRVDGGC